VVHMIDHQTSHCKVDGIDQAQTRDTQVVTLQLAEQVMQLPDAILHEDAELMKAGPIHPAHRLGLDGVIIVTKFTWHPFHSSRIRGSVRATRGVLLARNHRLAMATSRHTVSADRHFDPVDEVYGIGFLRVKLSFHMCIVPDSGKM
jgi:hypothetical protein